MSTTKRPTKKRKPRRTSDRVSRIAARVLASSVPAKFGKRAWLSVRTPLSLHSVLTVGDLLCLAASCLAQDEHRGPRETKGQRK